MRIPTTLVVLFAFVGVAAGVPGQAAAGGLLAPTLALQAEPASSDPDGALQLSARLVDPTGKPVGSKSLTFFVRTPEFGGRLMYLRTASTDVTGTAAMRYVPTWSGTQEFVTRFAGSDQIGPAEGRTTIDVNTIVPAHRAEAEPLLAFRLWFPVGLGTVVMIVWGVMFTLLARVLKGLS